MQEGYCSWVGRSVWCVCVCVCVCVYVRACVRVCVCVCVTLGASVRPENTVTYTPDNNKGQKLRGAFSETTPLQRSSTPSLKAISTVGHLHTCALYTYGGTEDSAL